MMPRWKTALQYSWYLDCLSQLSRENWVCWFAHLSNYVLGVRVFLSFPKNPQLSFSSRGLGQNVSRKKLPRCPNYLLPPHFSVCLVCFPTVQCFFLKVLYSLLFWQLMIDVYLFSLFYAFPLLKHAVCIMVDYVLFHYHYQLLIYIIHSS